MQPQEQGLEKPAPHVSRGGHRFSLATNLEFARLGAMFLDQ
jgi:hypothetical protein